MVLNAQIGLNLLGIIEPLGERLASPGYDNQAWVQEVRRLTSQLTGLQQEAHSINAPPAMKDVHDTWLLTLGHYANAGRLVGEPMGLVESGEDTVPLRLTQEVLKELALGKANIEFAVQQMEHR